MKVLKTLLLLSFALNIFLGGIFLGEKFSQKPRPFAQDSPVETVLTTEKRQAYQSGMEQAKQRFRQGRETYDALQTELSQLGSPQPVTTLFIGGGSTSEGVADVGDHDRIVDQLLVEPVD